MHSLEWKEMFNRRKKSGAAGAKKVANATAIPYLLARK